MALRPRRLAQCRIAEKHVRVVTKRRWVKSTGGEPEVSATEVAEAAPIEETPGNKELPVGSLFEDAVTATPAPEQEEPAAEEPPAEPKKPKRGPLGGAFG